MADFPFLPIFGFLGFLQRRRRARNTPLPSRQSAQLSQPLSSEETAAAKCDALKTTLEADALETKLEDDTLETKLEDDTLETKLADDTLKTTLEGDTLETMLDDTLETTLEDDALEDDGNSVRTMPPSYHEATATSEDPVGNDEADSSVSRIYVSHHGCCRNHNSIRLPNRSLLEQPRTSHEIPRSMPSESILLETESGDSNGESLFGLQSALTLAPIHSAMPCHLSIDHLSCIRRRLEPGTKRAFIPELSCDENGTSEKVTSYYWSNEIYFHKGTFLQKQEINCYLGKGFENPPEYFTGCPHQSVTVSTPEFNVKNEMLEVQVWVTNNQPRSETHSRERWSNFQGPYAQISICKVCHSDAEFALELENRNFHIRYTCYRNLGPGMDPSHPKWLALLTGEGIPHRQEYEPDVYKRVWRVANSLRRGGLYEVFKMGSARYRRTG